MGTEAESAMTGIFPVKREGLRNLKIPFCLLSQNYVYLKKKSFWQNEGLFTCSQISKST